MRSVGVSHDEASFLLIQGNLFQHSGHIVLDQCHFGTPLESVAGEESKDFQRE